MNTSFAAHHMPKIQTNILVIICAKSVHLFTSDICDLCRQQCGDDQYKASYYDMELSNIIHVQTSNKI